MADETSTGDVRTLCKGSYSAWLQKVKSENGRGKWLSSTNKRYFTIDFDARVLFYAHSATQKKVSQPIKFKDILWAERLPPNKKRKGCGFKVNTCDKCFELYTTSNPDAVQWVHALNSAKEMGSDKTKPHPAENRDDVCCEAGIQDTATDVSVENATARDDESQCTTAISTEPDVAKTDISPQPERVLRPKTLPSLGSPKKGSSVTKDESQQPVQESRPETPQAPTVSSAMPVPEMQLDDQKCDHVDALPQPSSSAHLKTEEPVAGSEHEGRMQVLSVSTCHEVALSPRGGSQKSPAKAIVSHEEVHSDVATASRTVEYPNHMELIPPTYSEPRLSKEVVEANQTETAVVASHSDAHNESNSDEAEGFLAAAQPSEFSSPKVDTTKPMEVESQTTAEVTAETSDEYAEGVVQSVGSLSRQQTGSAEDGTVSTAGSCSVASNAASSSCPEAADKVEPEMSEEACEEEPSHWQPDERIGAKRPASKSLKALPPLTRVSRNPASGAPLKGIGMAGLATSSFNANGDVVSSDLPVNSTCDPDASLSLDEHDDLVPASDFAPVNISDSLDLSMSCDGKPEVTCNAKPEKASAAEGDPQHEVRPEASGWDSDDDVEKPGHTSRDDGGGTQTDLKKEEQQAILPVAKRGRAKPALKSSDSTSGGDSTPASSSSATPSAKIQKQVSFKDTPDVVDVEKIEPESDVEEDNSFDNGLPTGMGKLLRECRMRVDGEDEDASDWDSDEDEPVEVAEGAGAGTEASGWDSDDDEVDKANAIEDRDDACGAPQQPEVSFVEASDKSATPALSALPKVSATGELDDLVGLMLGTNSTVTAPAPFKGSESYGFVPGLHCTGCDFQVMRIEGYTWTKQAAYMFFRNNYPNVMKLRKSLTTQQGCCAYCCQCSWKSAEDGAEISSITEGLRWRTIKA